MMEVWQTAFENKIPPGHYTIELQNGEEKGLIIKLISIKSNVLLNFGAVSAFRVLDEGVALNGLFDDEQINKFRNTGFVNVIYQVAEGNFDHFIQQIGGGLYGYLNLKHYVVISENYIVEIITEREPNIQLFQILRFVYSFGFSVQCSSNGWRKEITLF